MSRASFCIVFTSAVLLTSRVATAAPFTYDPPGQLVPSTSGKGRADAKVYEPLMRFPLEKPEAFANSQVYGNGGGLGPGGSQCDKPNFSYPWHDNYCESRSWDMPLCPSGTGHQGQDIRGASCVKNIYQVVAAADGTITNVGSYSVYLTTAAGTRFDYLHMGSVVVKVGATVKRGAPLGKVSNEFGGSATTVHLHLNIRQNIATLGNIFVPPYTSLVESYKRLVDPNTPIPDAGGGDAMSPDAALAPADGGALPDGGPLPNGNEDPDKDPVETLPGESPGCCATNPANGASGGTAVLLLALLATLRMRRRS